MQKDNGFTLAEVLITLAVIGVIAAATIPIIKHYQKQQYAAGLKRAYSQMTQMLKQYMADENVSSLEQTTLFAQPDNYAELDKIITKYFKTAKVCKLGDNSCQITESYLAKAGSIAAFTEYYYNFCTVDGMCFGIGLYSSNDCAPRSSPDLDKMKGACFSVDIDVNGIKPPNKLGRDFFWSLGVGPDGNLYPVLSFAYSRYMGITSLYWRNNPLICGTTGSADITNVAGTGCAARIMEEGWEMNY